MMGKKCVSPSSTARNTGACSSISSSRSRRVGSIIILLVIAIIAFFISSTLSPSSSSSSLWTATKNANEEGKGRESQGRKGQVDQVADKDNEGYDNHNNINDLTVASSIMSNSNSNSNSNNNQIPLPLPCNKYDAVDNSNLNLNSKPNSKDTTTTNAATESRGEDENANANTNDVNNKVLNIHVVPHTHDDVGWLKTIDQYYYGWNNTIQVVSVEDILTSVIESLLENPSRTFTYVEIKFFTMWYFDQTDKMKQKVKDLIHKTKQLTFVNGGWCMHDEAATHYIGMVDQTTLGHTFLKKELDYVPTVGWQLDPFGHSSTQASLMTYKLGFDALYFGRIDYQDLALRHTTQECEGLWNTFTGSSSTANGNDDADGSIFWGLTGSYNGNYGPPGHYCFDINCNEGYIPLIEMNSTQLIKSVNDFLIAVREQSDRTKGNHIMITMGEDFQYQRAAINFANLDLLIGTINSPTNDIDIPSIFGPQYDQVNIFYSSPEYYTECKYNETSVKPKSKSKSKEARTSSGAKVVTVEKVAKLTAAATEEVRDDGDGDGDVDNFNDKNKNNRLRRTTTTTKSSGVKVDDDDDDDSGIEWSTKYDDFFPYSDCPNCFWTGYFTSRPSLKKFERIGSLFLLASRQIHSSSIPVGSTTPGNDAAVTKTNNTSSSLSSYCKDQMYLLDDAHGVLQHHDGVSGTSKQHVAYDYAKRLQEGIDAVVPYLLHKLKFQLFLGSNDIDKYLKDLTYCQLLNETKCDVSVTSTNNSNINADLYVIVYNSLASERSTVIDLPVGSRGEYTVESLLLEDDDDEHHTYEQTIEAQQQPFVLSRTSFDKNNNDNDSSFVLSFMADSLPPVGAKVFRIRKQAELLVGKDNQQQDHRQNNEKIKDNNNIIKDDDDDLTEIFNGRFTVAVNTKTGNIHRIGSHNLKEQQQKQKQEGRNNNLIAGLSSWGYYTSFDSNQDKIRHDTSSQNSGAYVFRPSTPNQKLHLIPVTNTTVVNIAGSGGHGGIEIHTKYEESWIQTITRIRKDVPYIEIEYQVGPIPVDDGRGKEIVTRYNTNVDNDATFYTDSNGREFLKRQRNHRPTWDLSVYEPVAGNYYPVNTAIFVEGKQQQQEQRNNESSSPRSAFAVVTDRTQGGSSILDGTIELMVHRRILQDDGRGVGEPINETDIGITSCPPYGNATRVGEGLIIRGKHRIVVADDETATTITATPIEADNKGNDDAFFGGARLARSVMDVSFAEPLVFVGTAQSSEEIPFRVKSFSGLKKPLPHNIMLITKQLLYDENEATLTFLVRLGHQYDIGEDAVLSLPVDIDLSILFPNQSIKDVQETTLSGNRNIDDWNKERLDWTSTGRTEIKIKTKTKTKTKTSNTQMGDDDVSSGSYIITMTPMDIRTFKIQCK